MIVIDKKKCCGCLACKSVCSKKAISLSKDEKGFIYPEIDNNLCNNCGACKRICEFLKDKNENLNIQKVYAFKLFERTELLESTSGGAFIALSNYVLEHNGLVVGAVMDDEFMVVHKIAADKNVRKLMQKSKYVQSNMEPVFEEVIQKIKEGQLVLFVGTPCQVAQLVGYVGENRSNLLTCDFVCHGVPNNDFFKEHIRFLQNEYNKQAKTYYFRGKKYGWTHMMEEIEFTDGSIKGSKKVQAYSKFFYSGVSLRPSCLSCKYRGEHRYSDFTIADFWGIEKIIGKVDNEGISMITVNSNSGIEWIDKIKDKGEIIEVNYSFVKQKFIDEPISCTINVSEFWNIFLKQGYKKLVETYTDVSIKGNIKHVIKRIIKKVLYGVQ